MFFICNASTSVNATLLWKNNSAYIWQGNHSYEHQTEELITAKFIEELCIIFAPARLFYINLYHKQIPKSESDFTIVLNQLSILLMCNAEQSQQGEYQCFASNSNASGPSVNVKVEPSNKVVAVVSIATVMSVIVVITLIAVIVSCGCLRARAIKSEPIQMRPLHLQNLELNSYTDSTEFPRRSLQLDKILGK